MGRPRPGMRGVVGYKPGDSEVSVVVLSLLASCFPSSTLFFFWFFPSPPSAHALGGVGTLPRQSPVRFAASVHFLGGEIQQKPENHAESFGVGVSGPPGNR